MATVTKVTQQKRPGRYNIYLDDEFALAVDEKILIDYNLFKGTELTESQIAEVQAAEYEQKAYASGLLYATGQLRSRYQVYSKLREKDFPIDVINHALDRLENAHVIDDGAFAESYFQGVKHNGKFGKKGAIQKLKEWGVDYDVIEDKATIYDDEAEQVHLDEQIPKLMVKNQRKSKRLAEQSVTQKLLQKGFAMRNIQQAFQNYAENQTDLNDQDMEWENIQREGEKAFARYRQYTGWDLNQRVKAALARRGFDFDLINRFVTDNQKNN